MSREELLALADSLERADAKPKLRFSLFAGDGWITAAREPTIRALCDVWNNRLEVATSLRSRAAMGEGL